MRYNILLQTEALPEVKEAFEWYEEQKEGLGIEFLDELEIAIAF
jgi:toxin ParE1/3/4